MRRLSRLFFTLVLFGLVILAGILTMKTLAFSSKQIPVQKVGLPSPPGGAATRLAAAIRIPTISREEGPDSAAFRRMDTLIRRQYPLVDSMLELTMVNGFSRLYRWAGRDAKLPPILLMGHLDVVPVEGAGQWQVEPFSGAQRDGFIWGRGTLDDKTACFALLEAVETLLAAGYAPGRTVYLAFGHDEEISGLNGAKAIAAELARRQLRFDYILDEGELVLKDGLAGLDRPLAMIGIAEKGYVTLRLTASLPEGGHSSMPPRATAVGVLSQAVVRLQESPFPARIDGATQALLEHVGPEMKLPFRVLFANLWLTGGLIKQVLSADAASSAMIRTTTAPTVISGGVKDNVLPAEAYAIVNFRILPGETPQTVRDYVEGIVGDPRVKVKIDNEAFATAPSPVSDTRAFGFQIIQKTIQEVFPSAVVAPALVIGATDSRHFQKLSDCIYRFLPVELARKDLSRVHGIDERISEENYSRAIQYYRRLIDNSCK